VSGLGRYVFETSSSRRPILSPAVHDCDVLSFNKAGLLEALVECTQTVHEHFKGRVC
jgi:hypothetical protein